MCANIALANKRLNFNPSIRLEDGLRLTLQRDRRFRPA
jgi:nucleoside-diphosphate-sugar epimerase